MPVKPPVYLIAHIAHLSLPVTFVIQAILWIVITYVLFVLQTAILAQMLVHVIFVILDFT